jgi:hypothetical protein
MISSIFEFEMHRCSKNHSTAGLACKKPKEIETYINDVQIDVWQLSTNMDFGSFAESGPTFKAMELLYSNYLRHDEILDL